MDICSNPVLLEAVLLGVESRLENLPRRARLLLDEGLMFSEEGCCLYPE